MNTRSHTAQELISASEWRGSVTMATGHKSAYSDTEGNVPVRYQRSRTEEKKPPVWGVQGGFTAGMSGGVKSSRLSPVCSPRCGQRRLVSSRKRRGSKRQISLQLHSEDGPTLTKAGVRGHILLYLPKEDAVLRVHPHVPTKQAPRSPSDGSWRVEPSSARLAEAVPGEASAWA